MTDEAKIRVLWFNSDHAGCGSYRCYIPALSLEDRGFDSSFTAQQEVVRYEDSLAYGADVIVFQRAVGTIFIDVMKYCRAHGIVTVMEMDDDLMNIPRHNPSHQFWGRGDVQAVLKKQLELADHVVVSTPPLRESVLEHRTLAPTKVTVCCNHLHPTVWGWDEVLSKVAPRPNGDNIVIGWQGSMTHDADFKMCLPALSKILAEYPQVQIRFFGCVPYSVQGAISADRIQWSNGVQFDQYPSTLRYMNFDIGIAPVTPAKFNFAKSNIKWMEYGACRVPCVASAVYPYQRAITHGHDGFVARGDNEWYTALKMLIDDPALRRSVAEAAYATVWSKWANTTHAASWENLFRRLVREKHDAQVGA